MSGDRTPHVVIVGGSFDGFAAARALRNAPVRVTMLDRRNHNLFGDTAHLESRVRR